MKKFALIGSISLFLIVGLSICLAKGLFSNSVAYPQSDAQSLKSIGKSLSGKTDGIEAAGGGIAAIQDAAKAEKYLFAFFWKNKDDNTSAMNGVFDAAVKKIGLRVRSVSVCVADKSEKGIVDKFGLDRAPMPLVLAIAPNGAVMGGFPNKFTEQELLKAFGTPCTERCMKALQDGKLVFVCVQNSLTNKNDEALSGVRQFKADKQYAEHTEIVMLDPSDADEASFLADLKIDPKESEAVTAFLVPPGSVIAEFKGVTVKDELIATLQKASTACGPGGCGPGGCGPK
jgi:hypothetical protein